MTDHDELKSLIHSLASPWTDIGKKGNQLTPIYDRRYSARLLFESELNAFQDQILLDLSRIEQLND